MNSVNRHRTRALERLLQTACGTLAALALFAIMALTLADVTGRKLLSQSVPGSLELTELLMVVVIFAGLPLVSLRSEHVVFDSLDPLLPAWLKALQRRLVDACCVAALAGLAGLMALKAGQLAEYGDTTAQLHLPQAPFVYLMSALIALTAGVHLLLMLRPAAAAPDKAAEPATPAGAA
ncbi:MAG TPA: TRAP transporter small permease [Ideonella sp.]|nr:TRAP transporter small permease [Ideonella sp.]